MSFVLALRFFDLMTHWRFYKVHLQPFPGHLVVPTDHPMTETVRCGCTLVGIANNNLSSELLTLPLKTLQWRYFLQVNLNTFFRMTSSCYLMVLIILSEARKEQPLKQ